MSFLDLLKLAGLAGDDLVKLLQKVAADFPDLKDRAEAAIRTLEAAISPSALATLAPEIAEELKHLLETGPDPRFHPSDVV
jgi:hypothetical protein